MTIAVGAPVAERAWILPQWLECLSQQTIRPDQLCLVYSDSNDDTWNILADRYDLPVYIKTSSLPYYSRDKRHNDPVDKCRAQHMAKLRNELRDMFLTTDAEVFISLDTDILLRNPKVIELLLEEMYIGDWDVITPVTYLHPWGERSACYNAGFLGGGEGYTQVWARTEPKDVVTDIMPIDIPMGIYVMRRYVLEFCKYKSHECGEDIGFGQELKKAGIKVGWSTNVVVDHIWGKDYLNVG